MLKDVNVFVIKFINKLRKEIFFKLFQILKFKSYKCHFAFTFLILKKIPNT